MLTAQNVVLASSISKYGGGPLGLIVVLVLAFVVSRIAKGKGRSTVLWFVLGFIFPLISLIVVLVLPSKRD
ncbi:MAG: hypothetical protein H7233_14795 [Pseudorhodobacter sp.]|nr:hypothetical protein [Frankiaceae bacterium]